MKYPMSIGDMLPNGATVLDLRPLPDSEYPEFVVLAVVNHPSQANALEPAYRNECQYVTWRLGLLIEDLARGDRPGRIHTVWGHYFDKLSEAAADFETR